MAAWVGAAPHAGQLLLDERGRRRFNDWNHETGERIARGYEGVRVPTVGAWFKASCDRAAAEHAVDFDDGVVAHAFGTLSLLGKDAHRRANPSGVDEGGRRRRWLEQRTTSNTGGTLVVNRTLLLKPGQQCVEVAQQIAPGHLRGGVSVDEIKPESRARGHGYG